VVDLHGQVCGRSKLRNILLCNGGNHPSALRAGSGHNGESCSNEVEPWVLELKLGEAEEKFGVKKTALGSFIKATWIKCLLLSLKACLFLRNLSNRMVGLLALVLMRIPQ